ncbi:MAG: PEP-CTERM sorting domain-containing protein [Anaerolineaceae bacterium]|nr:PEP-CTERM sorting domain-containing protein [Anaerolineaceae bacterium]
MAGTFTIGVSSTLYGVLDTDGFTGLTIEARTAEHWGADDFSIAVPEPATLSLLALGGLALLRRRNK